MRSLTYRFALSVLILAQAGSPAIAADDPTAHDPQFDNRKVWGAWVAKADFYRQKWPDARLLIWRHAGVTDRSLRVDDPNNWVTEDGQVAETPPDKDTDVLFPSGDKQYLVAGRHNTHVRHMTVEPGVRIYAKSFHNHGNVWLKGDRNINRLDPMGPHDVFWRNDSKVTNRATGKMTVKKPEGRSVEFIGPWETGDELNIFSGTMIVGPDAEFNPGDRSVQRVYPKAQLVLLSGATFHKRGNQYWDDDIVVVGSLLAGTARRLLTKDAHLGLSFKSQGLGYESPRGSRGDRGMILFPQGRLAVHSANPEEAQLVIHRNPEKAQSFGLQTDLEKIARMPHGVDMLLLGEVRFDGVVFNEILKGGIVLRDPQIRKEWQHVYFEEDNFGSPDELFSVHEGDLDLEMSRTDQLRKLEAERAEEKKRK